jgi:hypothetical protein
MGIMMGSLRTLKLQSERVTPTQESLEDYSVPFFSKVLNVVTFLVIGFLGIVMSGVMAGFPFTVYWATGSYFFLTLSGVAFLGCFYYIFRPFWL